MSKQARRCELHALELTDSKRTTNTVTIRIDSTSCKQLHATLILMLLNSFDFKIISNFVIIMFNRAICCSMLNLASMSLHFEIDQFWEGPNLRMHVHSIPQHCGWAAAVQWSLATTATVATRGGWLPTSCRHRAWPTSVWPYSDHCWSRSLYIHSQLYRYGAIV